MVLGLKPLGKPTTWTKTTSFGQNQGLVWSSYSSLWGNQLLGQKPQVLDRTKALYGPRTQASGETNYLDKNYKFWTEPRPCMVLGLKPLGKPTTWTKTTSFGQNKGLVWSSDSSLWGNQLLGQKLQILDRTKALYGPRTQASGEIKYLEAKPQVLGKTKALYGSRTQASGETNYLDKNYKFWTEPTPCMVLGHKLLGKPTTWTKTTNFGQNQGLVWSSDSSFWGNQILRSKTTSFGQNQALVWSSDSSLWGNQLLGQKLQVLDRTKALYGPRTQASGETNYLDKNYKFWTEPRPCMVLGLKPLGKPTTWTKTTSFGKNQGLVWSSDSSLWGNQILRSKTTSFGQNQGLVWFSDSSLWGNQLLGQKLQVLDRTNALYGPRTQASGETNYLDKNYKFWTEPRPCMVLGLKLLGKPNT